MKSNRGFRHKASDGGSEVFVKAGGQAQPDQEKRKGQADHLQPDGRRRGGCRVAGASQARIGTRRLRRRAGKVEPASSGPGAPTLRDRQADLADSRNCRLPSEASPARIVPEAERPSGPTDSRMRRRRVFDPLRSPPRIPDRSARMQGRPPELRRTGQRDGSARSPPPCLPTSPGPAQPFRLTVSPACIIFAFRTGKASRTSLSELWNSSSWPTTRPCGSATAAGANSTLCAAARLSRVARSVGGSRQTARSLLPDRRDRHSRARNLTGSGRSPHNGLRGRHAAGRARKARRPSLLSGGTLDGRLCRRGFCRTSFRHASGTDPVPLDAERRHLSRKRRTGCARSS